MAEKLLCHVKSGCGLVLTLVLLCFFSGMFITNDVALITFVPFSFTVLGMLCEEQKDRLILPYTLWALALLTGWGLIQGRTCKQIPKLDEVSVKKGMPHKKETIYSVVVYFALFMLCLLAVGHILPWQAAFLAVVVVMIAMDRQVLKKVDYSLLLTFIGFFVFVGNVGRIPVFREFLQNAIVGRETYTAIIASQVISNVPAALFLSGFTEDFAALIIGTNLGGLGTLIASMASLISYKYVAKEENSRKGRYIALFTIGNLLFLGALTLLYVLLG